jgi:hypothetical protein
MGDKGGTLGIVHCMAKHSCLPHPATRCAGWRRQSDGRSVWGSPLTDLQITRLSD